MALAYKYATRAELKFRCGIPDATTTYDTRVDDALNTASRDIEKACGRQFNKAGAVTARVYEPCSAYLVEVDDFWTTTGLVVKTDTAADGTYATTVASTNYELRPLNGVQDGESGWPYWKVCTVSYLWPAIWQRAPIQVSADWGWNAVPSGVHEGCLILAEEIFKGSDTPFGSGGYGSFGIIRARQNPFCWQRIKHYAKQQAIVPVG